jgi:hypothetical protein
LAGAWKMATTFLSLTMNHQSIEHARSNKRTIF